MCIRDRLEAIKRLDKGETDVYKRQVYQCSGFSIFPLWLNSSSFLPSDIFRTNPLHLNSLHFIHYILSSSSTFILQVFFPVLLPLKFNICFSLYSLFLSSCPIFTSPLPSATSSPRFRFFFCKVSYSKPKFI